jgi:prophage tail gpP-like protein
MSAEIKSLPTPGFLYEVKSGDWISKIAQKAYGDAQKWPIIDQANSNFSETKELSGVPQTYFFPGQVIFVPVLPGKDRKYKDTITGKGKNDFTIFVDDIELPVEAGRLVRTMDTLADGWSCSFAWFPGDDTKLDKLTAPYSYSPSAVYLGGELKGVGKLYNVTHSISEEGRIKELEFFSKTVDAVDSTIKPPYEKNNIKLDKRIIDQVSHHGIEVIINNDADIGGAFKRVTAKLTDKVGDHILKLASQRGVLLTSDERSNLVITVANVNSKPVGTISEGESIGQEFEVTFKGRDRFTDYKAVAKNVGTGGTRGHAKDTKITGSRLLTFLADESLSGELKAAAEWRRNKTIADSLTFPIPAEGWYAPDGNLWTENTTVTIKSPTIGVPKGFKFLIRIVEYIFEESGVSSILSVVPPQAYTKEEFDEPWLI